MADVISLDPSRPRNGQSRYEADHFYFDTKEKHSHAENWQVKISSELSGWIAELLASRELPYRTKADLVRNAIMHEAHWAAQQTNPELRAAYELIKAESDASSVRARTQLEESIISKCEGIVEDARRWGTESIAEQHVRALAAKIITPGIKQRCLESLKRL